MFQCEVIGNLGADAKVVESNGSKFVTFRVANTEKYTQQDGKEVESTTWYDCTYNNVDSKVIAYLKQGTKVYVRGAGKPRLYSSPKLRQMVATVSVAVREIELVGGQTERVPRELIDLADGSIHKVEKFYWTDPKDFKLKKDQTITLVDRHSNNFIVDARGFIIPEVKQEQGDTQVESQTDA